MTQLIQFFRQIGTPTLVHVEDARELEAAVLRMRAVLDEARRASEELRDWRRA